MIFRSILLLLSLLLALPLHAQERILSYDSTVTIQTDGSMDVEERIRVRAEGKQIRRGIYRDFPTRYRDRYGNRMVVDFQVQEVLRNGQPEFWFTENMSNGVRLNTGNDDFLAVPGEYTYTLRFRTTRQIGFFSDHDELYWNAIGTGWAFPVEAGTVEVNLPQAVPMAELKAEGYTGVHGAKEQNFVATITAPGQAHWQLTRSLPPSHGLTTVLSFPKGIIVQPPLARRAATFLKDNGGVLIALLGLLVMSGYAAWRWHLVGRDPKAGIIIARYNPPEGYSPAALRFIKRMGADTRCMTSDLLSLAVAGLVTIERNKGLLKDEWSLQRTSATASTTISPSQQALLDNLFQAGGTLILNNKNHNLLRISTARQALALEKAYTKHMFQRNHGSVGIALLIAVASIVLAFKVSGGSGAALIVAIAVVMLAVLVVFDILVRAPTLAGRKMLDEIEGLKLYLGVAERDDIARLQGPDGPDGPDGPPQLDAERYQELLPYAVALDVEEAWTGKFTLAVGAAAAAAATAGIAWYRGGSFNDMNQLSNAIGKSLSSQIASASTAPGSSSGGGGGGSSGGGGGGGGGGGR